MRDAAYPHGMQLLWYDKDTSELWNLRMSQVVEIFGLPGDRYVTEIAIDNMTFWFREYQDALLFKLCHGHAELVAY